MRVYSKLPMAALVLAAAALAGVATDVVWNDGRLLSRATGRAGVEEACRPELAKALTDRGFSPNDIEFAERPALGFNFRSDRIFRSDFTFQDGPEATRIDGIMACQVEHDDVRVEVVTSARPLRAS